MDNLEIQENISLLEGKIQSKRNAVARENRQLTSDEQETISDCQAEINRLKGNLTYGPLTLGRGSHKLISNTGPFTSFGDQLQAVRNSAMPGAQVDPRLYQIRAAATGLGETVPADGGFLVQQDFTNELLKEVIQTGLLARRCFRLPISAVSNGIKVNAFDETSRAGSRFGGIIAYWKDEAALKTASKPKFRQMELNLKKLIGLCYASDELLEDVSALGAVVKRAFISEFGFQLDDAILNGLGAGQPLGVLNSNCLVSVPKEGGQHKETIVAENVIKMVERTLGPSTNYVWLHSKTCLSQIYSLSLAVGTGGVPLFIAGGSIPNFPENRLLGLPLIEVEQCPVLGTVGDLVLADLANGYVLAEKDGIKSDVSIHVQFIYDESVFRFVLRVDGQPTRATALTPYKGGASYTQSFFVALATRA